MGKVESDGSEGIGALRRLPEDRILFSVPEDSPEYQAFLEANKQRKQAREETGEPTPQAEEAYFNAFVNVSRLAKAIYAKKRAS